MIRIISETDQTVRHIVRKGPLVLCHAEVLGEPVRWLPEEHAEKEGHIMSFVTDRGAVLASATHGGKPVQQTKVVEIE